MTTNTEETMGRDLEKEALAVFAHLAENPKVGIRLDPELADFMGAFEETGNDLQDILDDGGLEEEVELEDILAN